MWHMNICDISDGSGLRGTRWVCIQPYVFDRNRLLHVKYKDLFTEYPFVWLSTQG